MLIDINLASWDEAKIAIYHIDQRLVFDTKNYDRLLVLKTLEDSEHDSGYLALEFLDKILGGYWIDAIASSRKATKAHIDLLTEHHENKGN